MIIKNADVLCIIGTERAHHVLTLHITAKNINPNDFINLNGKKNLELKLDIDDKMNGKCENCGNKTVRKYKIENEYESPACDADENIYKNCMLIKRQYATLPVHTNKL